MNDPSKIYVQPYNTLSEMDLDYLLVLLDEIDDNSQPQKKLLESSLTRLVENIFKLQYWETETGRDYQHWQTIAADSRQTIQTTLQQNPRLKKYLERIYPKIYHHTIEMYRAEFYVPENSTIELEQILQPDYFG